MRYLSVYLTLISFLAHSFCFAQTSLRKRINFDENWKFHFGHAANPEKDFNYNLTNIFSKSGNGNKTAIDVRFNDTTWRKLNLPHDWAVELPFADVKNFD